MLSLQGFKVIIMEDQPIVSLVLEYALKEAGAEISGVAYNVEEALKLLKETTPDAAVLDLFLAGKSAIPVVYALAAAKIPFILTSAYMNVENTQLPTAAHVFNKPYDLSDIIMAFSNVVKLDNFRPLHSIDG